MVLLLIMGAHTLKYLKGFSMKVSIIMNRAADKGIQLRDYAYKLRDEAKKSKAFLRVEQVFKNEIKKSRSLVYSNIYAFLMSKYNHLAFYPFRNRDTEKYDLLKPKSTFFNLLTISGIATVWMVAIFISTVL